jgi:Flp pilus assembly protein TadG
VRGHRLLTIRARKAERGSAPLEAVFAIVFLMVLVLGAIQVAFALYGRNVIAAAAHEGARAAIERGGSRTEATTIAREVVHQAAGRLVDDLKVTVAIDRAGEHTQLHVSVGGVLDLFGPVPLPLHFHSVATASSESSP